MQVPAPAGTYKETDSLHAKPFASRMITFKHPFTCIASGPTGSGKSTFCIRLLKNLDTLCSEKHFAGGIVWCYSERTAVPSKQLARLKNKKIIYHEGVPDDNFFKANTHGKPSLIVLDDLLQTAYSEGVSVLFTRGSHHRNISVILITQNLFHQARHARDISLNAKYIILLKNVRDKAQFTHLARQVLPEDSQGLFKAYLQATKRPHGYLLIDLAQDTDDRVRFRTNIFPCEYPSIAYVKIGDETDKVEL